MASSFTTLMAAPCTGGMTSLTGSFSIFGSITATKEPDDTKALQSELLLLAIMSTAEDKRKIQTQLIIFVRHLREISLQWQVFVDKHKLLEKIREFPIV
jgi:hypothetical protein